MVARPLHQPAPDQRRLMGGSIVEHKVHVKIGRHLAVDQVEESANLLTAVPLAAGADHLSRLHIQGSVPEGGVKRQQIGCAVTHVIMGPSLDLARPHWQHRSSMAWIWGFSSTHRTRARSCGTM